MFPAQHSSHLEPTKSHSLVLYSLAMLVTIISTHTDLDHTHTLSQGLSGLPASNFTITGSWLEKVGAYTEKKVKYTFQNYIINNHNFSHLQ